MKKKPSSPKVRCRILPLAEALVPLEDGTRATDCAIGLEVGLAALDDAIRGCELCRRLLQNKLVKMVHRLYYPKEAAWEDKRMVAQDKRLRREMLKDDRARRALGLGDEKEGK